MRKLILLNNRKTTLNGTLSAVATTMNRSLLASDIIPVDDLTALGEFEVRATLTDDTNVEIVALVFDNGAGVITLERGLEGTLTRAWNAGAKFEFRLTAGMLRIIGQHGVMGFTWYYIEALIAQAVAANTVWALNTTYLDEDVVTLKSGANFQWALYCLKGGMVGIAEPVVTVTDTIIKDGAVYWLAIRLNNDGSLWDQNTALLDGQGNSFCFGNNAYSAGLQQRSVGGFSSSFGSDCINYGNKSMVMGYRSYNLADEALVITPDGFAVIPQINFVKNALVLDYIPSRMPTLPYFTSAKPYQGGVEGVIWTPPMDLTGGAAWVASQAVTHGQVRRPTSANGFQYLRYDNNYGLYSGKFKADYTPGLTGASQPTWGTTPFLTTPDGGGEWLCLPNVGMTLTLPDKFIPKQIGVVVLDYSAITVQPSLSFGKSGNNALFKANGATTLLTAADKVQLYDVTAPEATDTLTFSINTLATGTRLLCQFFVQGQLCPRWY